jgi:excinuclease UvrABC nuclease subunit
MSWVTYKIVDTITEEIIYIGCTGDFEKRRKCYICLKGTPIKIMNYLGGFEDRLTRFTISVVKEYETKKECLLREQELIKKYKPKCNINHNNFDIFVEPLVFKKITKEGVEDFISKFKIN